MSVAFPSSPAPPARCCVGRAFRFAFKLLFVVAVFAGGTYVGARWGDQCPILAKRTPSTPATTRSQQPEQIPSGLELLASLDRRMLELRDELATAERTEREAEIACNLLRKQGAKTDAPAYREQEQAKARATARKSELAAEVAEATRMRAELLAAMAEEKSAPGPVDSELNTRVRAFVIRQELLRDPAPKPAVPSSPK